MVIAETQQALDAAEEADAEATADLQVQAAPGGEDTDAGRTPLADYDYEDEFGRQPSGRQDAQRESCRLETPEEQLGQVLPSARYAHSLAEGPEQVCPMPHAV